MNRKTVIHRFVLGCLLFLISSGKTVAQYHFESWDTERGLPQNTVHSILQTQDGYLWLATSDGLVRFDGVHFSVFNIGNTKGITSNRCDKLYEDHNHTLWISAEDGQVIRYRDGSFESYSLGGSSVEYAARGILEDQTGTFFISTMKGFVKWNGKGFVADPGPAASPCKSYYRGFTTFLWCQERAELHLLNSDGSLVNYSLPNEFSNQELDFVFIDKESSLWLDAKDYGLARLRDGIVAAFKPNLGTVKSIFQAHDGLLWIATSAQGLMQFDGAAFKSYTTANGLSDNDVLAIYEDRENSIWVGTTNHGLARVGKYLITTYAGPQGLTPVNVYPILEDHAGSIWLGTWPNGWNVYQNGSFTHHIQGRGQHLELVTALAEDHEGQLWIGALDGAARYQNGKLQELTELNVDPRGVFAILEDHEGNMWFSTEAGLKKYRDGQLTIYTTKDGLAGNEVKALLEDRQGNLWIATYGGLSRFKDGVFQSYTRQDGLASNHVRSLYEDRSGALWIGTYDDGLSRLKDGKIVSYTVPDGLFDGGVFQILEDDRGNFWMSCNHGIYRVSRKELEDFAEGRTHAIHSVAYGTSDGMRNVECNGGTQPAGIKTHDGRLWFPTQDGVAVINPNELVLNSLPPPIVIESGVLDQKAVDLRAPLQIEPGQNSLEIHYTALSFIKPEQVRFRYRLEGLDRDWVEAGSRRVAYYTHLPPGHYTFVVVAANADGVWNEAGQRVQITVVPPFWRRGWFLTLSFLAVTGAVYFLYRRRVEHLHQARVAQEAFSRQLIDSQENERKRIAAELHDSIGQSLLVIKNQAQFALMKTPDNGISEEIDEIKSSASQAINEVREIAYNLRPYHLDRVGLTRTIEAIIDRIGAASGIRFQTSIANIDGLLSNEGEINLYRVVQEALNNIVKHADAREATIEVSRAGNQIRVRISDQGRGFDSGEHGKSSARGFGLIGITERVRMLGGNVSIQSSTAQGTTISFSIQTKGQTERGKEEGEKGRKGERE